MPPVYICEEDKRLRDEVEKEIKEYIDEYKSRFWIEVSTNNPGHVLDQFCPQCDRGVYFLGVDAGGETEGGYKLGSKIRRYDTKGFIIYIIHQMDDLDNAFSYHLEILDYLPDEKAERRQKIRNCLRTIERRVK